MNTQIKKTNKVTFLFAVNHTNELTQIKQNYQHNFWGLFLNSNAWGLGL